MPAAKCGARWHTVTRETVVCAKAPEHDAQLVDRDEYHEARRSDGELVTWL